MPTCPGCEQTVPHDRLAVHERLCPALRGGDADAAPTDRTAERRIANMERRIQRRLRRLEADLAAAAAASEAAADDGGRFDRSRGTDAGNRYRRK